MKLSAIIVDGRHRSRRIDATESQPRALDIVDDDDRSVLDWTLHTLRLAGVDNPLYVGSYHIEKVLERYPDLHVRYYAQNDGEGELGAFLQYEPSEGSLLIVSASTILLPGSIERLASATAARGTYNGAQPLGAYFLKSEHVAPTFQRARHLFDLQRTAGFEALFNMLGGIAVNLDGVAAPVTDQEAVARAIFRGKAQTLDNLAPVLKGASFLPRERFTLVEWQRQPEAILDHVGRAFAGETVVVRSSVAGEDSFHESRAGKYRSVLGVWANDPCGLRAAISDVAASYGNDARELHVADEILIQPQLVNIRASGVLLTRDPRTTAPYFVINEDQSSGRSDSVTDGSARSMVQRFVLWPAAASATVDEHTRKLLSLAAELIRLSRIDALDVEYAVTADGVMHLLQVRPLAAARYRSEVADSDVFDLARGARTFVQERMRPVEGLAGRDTVLGVMPDWNPAEMIGVSPRPLALSVYQLLIGQESWAEARCRIGYRDVRPEPLIVSLAGRPYVDVRASLNSFIPMSVDDATAARWVDACLERLRQEPTLHDKIEFDIAITCIAPDWEKASRRLTAAGIDRAQYGEHLRRLTADIIAGRVEPIAAQLGQLEKLGARRARHLATATNGVHDIARLVSHLLADCRQIGLTAFSILARYAFISMSFLRGLRHTGAISQAEYDAFLHSVPTVASMIAGDLGSDLPVSELIERYGHLRPDSYEITSGNYASDSNRFLKAPAGRALQGATQPQSLLREGNRAVLSVLERLEIDATPAQLEAFLSGAIAGREFAKFEFMKNVNAALEGTAALGERLGLDREQMSFLSIADILRLGTDSLASADRAQMRRRSAYNEKRWAASRALRLPDVVMAPDDVQMFRLEAWRANFITRKRVEARAVWLDESGPRPNIAGAIVVTRAADPGYDWLFAHGIAGLVTEYGGIASHMSIRAAEFGLPAAIGCGSVILESLRGAERIALDCAAEKVRPLPC